MEEIFQKARAVFVPGLSDRKNTFAAFRCDFVAEEGKHYQLILAAHSFYRVFLNGSFLGFGPAPAPFGQLKADRYFLETAEEINRIAIEIIGYVPEENNFLTHENSCLLAEVVCEGGVLCSTGDGSFSCGALSYKNNQMETLSFGRRVPVESYILDENYTAWRTGTLENALPCELIGEKRLIREREVLMPDFDLITDLKMTGIFGMKEKKVDIRPESWWETPAYIERSGGKKMCRPAYECALLEDGVYEGRIRETRKKDGKHCYELSEFAGAAALEFVMRDAETGLIGISFSSTEPVTVDIMWNDYLDESGQLPVKADSVNRVIRLHTEGGSFSFESIEPHYIKYIKVIFHGGGSVALEELYVRVYRFPDMGEAEFVCSDMDINRIYEGAKRTLLTNSLAFFLDSPERERGGWAGDSYWTGRAAAMLLSDTTLEKAMLKDFLAADYSPMLEGSFPACCSGGPKNDPVMMYSWNLFVLLELTDYYGRTCDEEMKEAYRERVNLFMEASEALKNELGLLENIPGSMFVDWSSSNDPDHTQPICTAANALYALVAERLGKLYDRKDFSESSIRIRVQLRSVYEKVKGSKQELFTMYPFLADSLSLREGELCKNGVYSEAAQYYYFWTNLLTKNDAEALFTILKEQFGPVPEKYRGTAHLRIGSCGVFFGYMMRFELLARYGEIRLLEKELKELCSYMLDRDPETFWETLSGTDSRNHGFGSYYGVFAVRDFLGLGIPDRTERKIRFAPGIGSLKWAKGSILTADGRICASFSREEDKLRLCMSAPEGYRIEVEIPKEYCFYEEMRVNGRTESLRRYFTEGNIVSVELGYTS